jgi:predicted nucleic acid-binding protein
MGVRLADRIPDGGLVLIDTNPIIYWFEGSDLAAPFESIFLDIEARRFDAMVTPVTIAEVVTGPLRAGKDALAERYRQAMTESNGFSVRDTSAHIAMLAARLRVRHNLKSPDAIQIATAIDAGCFAVVSRDRDFSRVKDILILGMD